jgi:hypothetical protein
MIELIPQKCVDLLPLSAEPIASWSSKSDIKSFLCELYDAVDFRSYGNDLFAEGKKRFRKTLRGFHRKAIAKEVMPGAAGKAEAIPDFGKDSHFGLMAKGSIAWSAVCGTLLEESAFFSLPHILETEMDLEASILLSSDCFYRHALEMLRNYLEGVVLQLYFCDNPSDFARWRQGTLRVPSFRHKDRGLLATVQSRGLLPAYLSQTASQLYGDLSSSIHGAEQRLINAGVFTGDWKGLIFKYDYFANWCNHFARCVNIGIPVLRLSTNLWLGKRPQGSVYCDVCHNEDITKFGILKTSYGVTLTCRKCGSQQNRTFEWAVSQGFQEG